MTEDLQPGPAAAFDSAWTLYEQAKAAFLQEHPQAGPQEIEANARQVAERLGL
jgi:hypothetical protein